MSDNFRKLLEQQEALRRAVDPFEDMRKLAPSWSDTINSLGVGSETLSFLKQYEKERKLLSSIVDDYRISGVSAETLMRISEDAEMHRGLLEGPIEEARRMGFLDPHSDIRSAMETALEANRAYERMFRLPELDETMRLATQAMNANSLTVQAFSAGSGVTDLQSRMGAIRAPWLNMELLERSSQAFTELQAIGQMVTQRNSFDGSLAGLLRSSLGDWRDLVTIDPELLINPHERTELYVERGFNPALTDFTVPAFEESLEVAGFYDSKQSEESDEYVDVDEAGLARNRAAFDRLQRFEIAVRRFINDTMQAAYGDGWYKRQLPNGMLDRWMEKKEAARKAGEPDRPLIEYADFTDYRTIIERKDNWNDVFKSVFGRPDDVRESFQRLFPVRIATMHARIITLDDELFLLTETKRILRAIRRIN